MLGAGLEAGSHYLAEVGPVLSVSPIETFLCIC